MPEPDPRQEAIANATAWLRENDTTYSPEALRRQLREAGYTDAEISWAAMARAAERELAPPVGPDLRMKAAGILLGSFFAVWLALTLFAARVPDQAYHSSVLESIILAVCLGAIALVGLLSIRISVRLRRGVEGALLIILALPFVMMFGVAGLCLYYEASVR